MLHLSTEKLMPRYLMNRFGLLRLCGKTGKTKIFIDYDNDVGVGSMVILTENEELLLSDGVKELFEKYGEKLAP